MPARVHALLVVRPDGRTPAVFHLRRTLAAVEEQSRRVDALTIVVCGSDPRLSEVAASSGAESVITAPHATSYAAATAMATLRVGADAVWLLAQDTAPEPDALAGLAGELERSPSVAIAAPKLVRWDDRAEIVSLGVSMTRAGRTVGLADGEFDQGQHDARDDVLGSDVRGVLVRTDDWRALGGIDRALAGADEGLDLGVRARLTGARVALVPSARVAVGGDGVVGPPSPVTARRRARIAYATRAAQLHRRLVYAPAIAVPLAWLAILPIAALRTLVLLVRKQPATILPEWRAAFVAMARVPSVARARARVRRTRAAGWAQLEPLRVTRSQLRAAWDDGVPPAAAGAHHRGELRFFTGGGAWLVLAAAVASVAAFPALLAWPVLGGGGLQPLAATVAQLWADAAYGTRALGLDEVGPADPFAGVLAVIGTLSPDDPSRALVVLWLLALPLASLGGWFAATRVTDRSVLRFTGGVVWALAPTFLTALTHGRPAAVIAHLLLPWLFYAGAVAYRSWVAAGAASLLLAGVVACAPQLAPALAVLWAGGVCVLAVRRAGRGIPRMLWLLVPVTLVFAPLLWHQLRHGDAWAMFADPGVVWTGPQAAADPSGRALLAAGLPAPDFAGWATILPDGPTWWVPLVPAPLALLALAALLTARWSTALVALVIAATGLATAFAAVGVSVSSSGAQTSPLWPGTALSLAWLGVLAAALVALDTSADSRAALLGRFAVGALMACALVLAGPALTSMARDAALLVNGPSSTLPAYVAAEGRGDPNVGTLVLVPQPEGGVAADVVWGASETLSGQSTAHSTRTEATSGQQAIAAVSADLVASSAAVPVDALASAGVGFVLLASSAGPESEIARAFRLTAANALDQRDGLEAVGDTPRGSLWRVAATVEPRAVAEAGALSRTAVVVQLAAIAAALLLAVPTAAARREARRWPRVVGRAEAGGGGGAER